MIPLSRAIRQGTDPDPLRSALSVLPCGADLPPLQALYALYGAWPYLCASVRLTRGLAERLPKGIVEPYSSPRSEPSSMKYRCEIHTSLYRVITVLHNQFDWKKDKIADLLQAVHL